MTSDYQETCVCDWDPTFDCGCGCSCFCDIELTCDANAAEARIQDLRSRLSCNDIAALTEHDLGEL